MGIAISALEDLSAPSLGTFDLDVAFDRTILTFESAVFGDPGLGDQLDLFGLGSIRAVAPGTGVVNLFQLSLDSADGLNGLQAGAFRLATLTFDTLKVGIAPLGLTINTLGDAAGGALAAGAGAGEVTVRPGPGGEPIPGPPTLFLVGSALAGLAFLRRGRRSRN